MLYLVSFKVELTATLVLVASTFFTLVIMKKAVNRIGLIRSIEANRRKVIINICYFVIYALSICVLILIWGLDFKQFTLFISSVLAVLGVGFFAQWSILSNLTASAILFFNHPVRIGHRIRVLDKDFDLSGEVKDITGFYLFMVTDEGKHISLPNSMVLQKGIEILDAKPENVVSPEVKHSNTSEINADTN